jgi:hypothetical protein
MTGPQEQLAELTRRTQENFKQLWDQWSHRSNELIKGVGGRSRAGVNAPGNPEDVIDAVFDFAENLIAQQRTFAKQMLRTASQGQQAVTDAAASAGDQAATSAAAATSGAPRSTTPSSTSPTGTPDG